VRELTAVVPDAYRLVFVDGFLSDEHSALEGLPAGLSVHSLEAAIGEDAPVLARRMGKASDFQSQPLVALNTALMADGALVHIGRNAVLDKPIVVLNVGSAKAEGSAVYPRALIEAEEGAQATVVEFYRSAGGAMLSAPVSEIFVGANARVDYYRVEEEGSDARHLAHLGARVERDGMLSVHAFSVGGKVARTDIYVDLDGKGAEAELNGLTLTREGQYLDHHTWMNHNCEHGSSRQRFKSVLDGKSETVFDGLVRVAPGAQKTDARQENRNLLLSKRALAHSNPRLEIHADDVKCSHGSTTGELDRDALFYLRSRGINERDAQGLLTFAFVNEMLEPVRIDALRDYEREQLMAYLPGGGTQREGA
jgi:Fe-S cluster assembly protein SufD